MSDKPALSSAQDVIDALCERPIVPYKFKKADGTYLTLALRAVPWSAEFHYDQEYGLQSAKLGENKAAALAGAELVWIYYGVVHPETGEPLFKSLQEAKKLREGNAAAVKDLLAAIQVVSGKRAAVDWDAIHKEIRASHVEGVVETIRSQFGPLLSKEEQAKEVFDTTLEQLRLALEVVTTNLVEDVETVVEKKMEYSPEIQQIGAVSEDDLGNGSTQTPSDTESGASA